MLGVMKNNEILIKRTILGWFTTEFVNFAQDRVVYRRVDDFQPDKDKHLEFAQGSAEVAAVRKLLYYATKTKMEDFAATGVLDGVSYDIYIGHRQLRLFCPDCSPDPAVRELSARLDKLFEQFGDSNPV